MAVPRQPSSTYRRQAGSAGTLSGARKDLAIQIEGLREFNKALKAISPDTEKEFKGTLRTFGRRALTRARSNTPVGKPYSRKGALHRPGTLQRSIKLSVTQKDAALYSNSVYARAHEWGTANDASSQVQPKGVPLGIPRSQMLGNAVYFYRNAFGYEMANLINRVARENGLEAGPTVRQSSRGGRIIEASN